MMSRLSFDFPGMLYLAVLVLGIIALYAKYIENNSVFFPAKTIELYPSALNLLFEDVYIKTEDNLRINGWFMPVGNAAYTILFCHGNAGNLADRLEKLRMLLRLGLNIFIIDYRGYGKSEGRPSQKGFYMDTKAAYNYLVNNRRTSLDQIILYGESLGTAVAIDFASRAKVRAIILEGAFSSGKDMARRRYPYLPTFLFSDKFDSLAKIKMVEAPKLFVHSRDDEIVPFALADKLYRAADGPKAFAEITGGHNSAFADSQEKYLSAISSFIEKLQ